MPKSAKDFPVEPVVCEGCHHVNIVYRKPFDRREPRSYSFKLEPAVFEALRYYVRAYGTWNNGFSMLLYEIEKMKLENSKNLIRNIDIKNMSDNAGILESEE